MKYLIILMLIFTACKGSSGNDGAPGQSIVGPVGPSGATGADGATITVVTFCPGTTSYPSTFLEVGLCINNQIFGVYSANNGFLALLPPGSYASNAVGSVCNFTILPNCVIQ